MILYQSVLPGGRGVRYAPLDTEAWFACEERAAAKVGAAPDPQNKRMDRHRAVELICTSLKQISQDLVAPAYVDEPPRLDLDAMLADVTWCAVDPMALTRGDSPWRWPVLLASLADFAALADLVQRTLVPERGITVDLGKGGMPAMKVSV